jgi:mersacidin/lichenicidin family type 2 lantibiotic
MKKELIVRAWKDPSFRASLSAEERSTLPESPSGRALTELDEAELLEASGGRPVPPRTCGLCMTANSCGIVACVPSVNILCEK